jgi:hypothetical protein
MHMQKMLSKGTSTRTRVAYYELLCLSDSVINMCERIRCSNVCLLRLDATSAGAMKILSRTKVIIKLIHEDYFVVHIYSPQTNVYLNYI